MKENKKNNLEKVLKSITLRVIHVLRNLGMGLELKGSGGLKDGNSEGLHKVPVLLLYIQLRNPPAYKQGNWWADRRCYRNYFLFS